MITQEQREARRKGLGGSDIAAIIKIKDSKTGTLSPWSTEVDIWNSKMNPDEEVKEENEAMVWGNLEEGLVAKRFEQLSGKEVAEYPDMIVDGCLLANLDRIVRDEDGKIREILEAKTSSCAWDDAEIVDILPSGTEVRDGSQGIPAHYQTQCNHYLGRVPTAERIYVAAKLSVPCGKYARTEFGIYVLERDDDIISAQDAYAREWWERHIVGGVKPEPVCEADCKILWRRSLPATHITATNEILKAYNVLREARKAKEEAEAAESVAKAVLQKAMGENEAIVGSDGQTVVATWKSAKDKVRIATDWERLARSIAIDANITDDDFNGLVKAHTTTETKPGARTFLLKTSEKVQQYVDAALLDSDAGNEAKVA